MPLRIVVAYILIAALTVSALTLFVRAKRESKRRRRIMRGWRPPPKPNRHP